MPYLHREKFGLVDNISHFIEERGGKCGRDKKFEPPCKNLKMLLDHYLDCHGPIHNRRTFDQYYYRNLSNTRHRDCDQLIGRLFQRRSGESSSVTEQPVLMVDQLWLWVLPDQGVYAEAVPFSVFTE